MLEIVVVAAVVLTALVSMLALRSGSEKSDRKISAQEEYYNLQARLMTILKNDLRSAFSIKKNDDSSVSLECLKFNGTDNSVQTCNIIYQARDSKKQKIERIIDGKPDKSWDFSNYAEGREFKFEISLTD